MRARCAHYCQQEDSKRPSRNGGIKSEMLSIASSPFSPPRPRQEALAAHNLPLRMNQLPLATSDRYERLLRTSDPDDPAAPENNANHLLTPQDI